MRKLLVIGIVVLSTLATPASSQEWPAHTLIMINPFAAGGAGRRAPRLFAQRMGEIIGQSVIVENVGGAGSMNGADRVAKAPPDGYTFLLGTVGTQAQNQTLYTKPAYDSTNDFCQCRLCSLKRRWYWWRESDYPASSMNEFVAYAKNARRKNTICLGRHRLGYSSRLRLDGFGEQS